MTEGVLVPVQSPGALARAAEQDALHDHRDPWRQASAMAEVWLRSPGFSDGTKEQYRMIYTAWYAWCLATDVPPFEARRSDVDAYVNALLAIGNPAAKKPVPLSRRSVTRHMAVISSFYTRAVDDEVTDRNPVPRKAGRPKFSVASKQPHLTHDELVRLIAAADADSPRTSALVALMVMACLRVSEALNANVENLSRQAGVHVLWVTRKEDKSEHVPIPPEVYQRIKLAVGNRKAGPIIATSTGRPMDRANAWKLIRALGRTAGLEADIGPHTLRHAYITRGHELEVELTKLQRAAGHQRVDTTRGYDRSHLDPESHPSFLIAKDLAGE